MPLNRILHTIITVACLIGSLVAGAQDIARAEYFFNTDPGVGNAITIEFPDANPVTITPSIPTTGLDVGIHYLYIRVQNTDGEWSIAKRIPVHIQDQDPPTPQAASLAMVEAEYFIDTDPGVGNGTVIPGFVMTNNFSLDLSFPVGVLPEGDHYLYIRTRDLGGNWAIAKRDTFTVEAPLACTVPQVFFETDTVDFSNSTTFTNLSTDVDVATVWSWDVGVDGSIEGTGSTFSHTFATPGFHYVQLTADNGGNCQASYTGLVVVGPLPDTGITADGPLEFCEGESVNLTAAPGLTYVWSNGESTQSINVTTAGDYSVQVTNGFGVTLLSDFVQVEVNELPSYFTVVNDETNGNGNGMIAVVPNDENDIYTYLWNTLGTENAISGLVAGSYDVDISNANCTVNEAFVLADVVETEGLYLMEYFFDSDPGVGNGAQVSLSEGTFVDSYINIPVGLGEGQHHLYMRLRDLDGSWGITKRQKFLVYDPVPPIVPESPIVTDAEYFINTDPGVGNGTPVDIVDGDAYTENISVDVSLLPVGQHYIYVRTKDLDGKWGLAKKQQFYIIDDSAPVALEPSAEIIAAEYFFDTDPGVGMGIPLPKLFEGDNVSLTDYLPTAGLAIGPHIAYVRVLDDNDKWSITKRVSFDVEAVVCTVPQPDFTSDVVMMGTPTSFSNLTTDYDVTTTWEWDILNDDVVEGTTFDYSYVFATPGIYLVRLTATTTPECYASVVHQVTVLPAPDPVIVATGPLSFCDGSSVTLIAEAGNTYLWNTGETTQSITVSTSGIYSCEITNGFGFTIDSENVTVEVFPVPEYTIFANQSNGGMNNGSASVIQDNPLDEYTYLWSDGQTTSSAVNLLAGVYTVEITNGGCTVIDGVVVTDNPVSAGLVEGEYFFDTDPGAGNGTPVFFTQGDNVDHIDYADVSALPAGVHYIYLRLRDDDGKWGIAKRFEFDIIDDSGPQVLPPAPQLVGGEYFIGTDPGPGNGVAFSFAPADAVSDAVNISTAGWDPGEYLVYVRLINAVGEWGLTKRHVVYAVDEDVVQVPSSSLIYAAEYFIDIDPGPGNGIPIDAPFPADPVDISTSISVAGYPAGSHDVWVRVKDMEGKWSITKDHLFTIDDVDCISPQVDFSYVQVDAGVPMNFTNLSTDVDGLTAYQWDVFNDGLDDAVTENLVYTFATPGIYEVALTATNYVGTVDACESQSIQYVTVGPTPDVNIVADGPLEFCEGGSVTLSVDPGNTYLWSTGATTNSILVYESGSYWVMVTDAYMTLWSGFVEVIVNELPILAGTLSAANNGNTNGSIILDVTGGTGTYTYNWSDGQTTQNAVALDDGIYSVTVDDGLCIANGVFTVNDVAATGELIAAEYFFDTDPGAGNGTPLEISIGDSFNQPAYIGVGALSPGVHFLYLRALDEFGAWSITKRHKVSVYETAPPVTLPPAPDLVDAEYFINTDPGVELADGIAIPVGPTVSQAEAIDVSSLPIGDHYYYTRLKDADDHWGISKRIPFTITELCSPYSTTHSDVTCYAASDGQAEIIIAPGNEPYDIQWSNGDVGPIATNLGPGDITVTATDVNGCVIQEVITITEPTEIFLTVDPSTSMCLTPSGTATSTVTGGVPGYGYLWSSGETTVVPTALPAGQNYLQITDATGCVETLYFDVLPNDGPLVSGFVNAVTCYEGANGSVTLNITDGVPPYDVLWGDGQTSQVAVNLEEGIHDVTVTDDAGCAQNFSYYVGQPLPISTGFASVDVTYYEGNNGSATVFISGGTPGYSILWNTGETTQSIEDLTIGEYYVDITDALGCTASDTLDILDAVICLSDSINLEVDMCIGETIGLFTDTGIYYEWSTGSNDATIYVSPPDTTVYDLYRLDVNGCPYYDTVTVNVIDETVNAGLISGPLTLNLSELGAFLLTGSIGTIQWQYSYDQIDWTDIVGATSDSENLSFDQAGIVYLRAEVESGTCGTSYSPEYAVTIDDIIGNRFDIPIVIPTLDYADTRDKAPYTDNYVGAGNQPSSDVFYQYTIEQCTDSIVVSLCGSSFDTYLHILDDMGNQIASNNNSIECGPINSLLTLTGTTEGETYYFVVEGNGAADGIIQLDVYNIDPFVETDIVNICSGESTTLTTELGSSFLWSNTETTSSIVVSPVVNTTYYVDITNDNGCVYQDSAEVFVTATSQITVSVDTAICFGGTAMLDVTGSDFYSWSSGQTTDMISVSPFIPTLYTVTGTDLNGCQDEETVFVDVEYAAPAQPTLTSPLDASTDLSLPLIFDWEDITDASAYNLYIWPSIDPMPVSPSYVSFDNTEEVTSGLLDDVEYQWTVEAINACGSVGFDPGWTFTLGLPCPADFNNDGVIDTLDLLEMLAGFGCIGICVADIDMDGVVNTTDLLLFLSVYGTACP